MSTTGLNRAAAWLTDADEDAHEQGSDPLWSENWLTYGWSPRDNVGVYFHIGRHPGATGVYEETFNVYLPGDRFLAHRGFAPVRGARGPVVAGVSFRCDEPFLRWTKRFQGAARLVTGEELRAGPLRDGPCLDVEVEVTTTAISPPFDFGAPRLDQSWGSGHYEQHLDVRGKLVFADQSIEIVGTGLRDHSWGPRDWNGVGDTTWYHGQFPESGRAFMVVSVPGRPPYQPFVYAVVSDRDSVRQADVSSVPEVTTVYQSGSKRGSDLGYQLGLATSEGPITIGCEIIQSMPMTFLPPTQIGIGTHRGPEASHQNVETITRFTWDGEVGYGLVTACRDLSGPYGDGR
jgi:hypothetical protein